MNRIPLSAKVLYTVWMAVWVPVYWQQNGPENFLWLCDFANWVLFLAIWQESALLVSAQLAGVFLIQLVWAVDFSAALLFGTHPVGGTEYMFDAAKPLWLRGLSLFHLWTIPLLVWLVRQVGYDRRGWRLQVAIAAVLFPLGVVLGTREQNLNWMYAPFGLPQTLLDPLLFAFVAVPIAALLLFVPGDWIARRFLVR
ncbi:MAG: hypothetical protein KBA72_13230 [Thermoanaerobaculia bacterium]|nr:hypothetical protein [Thermoanaerobaculia bacterium]